MSNARIFVKFVQFRKVSKRSRIVFYLGGTKNYNFEVLLNLYGIASRDCTAGDNLVLFEVAITRFLVPKDDDSFRFQAADGGKMHCGWWDWNMPSQYY